MNKTNEKRDLNVFFFDATSFIAKADELIKPKMSDSDAILALLLASIGLEKLLKGILFDINPLFVFPKPTFEESSEVLYNASFIENIKPKHLTDLDTISFRTALQRTKLFSKTVTSHFSLLYTLANTRNLVAHNICDKIDRSFLRPFLLKEFRPLLREFNDELKFNKDTFFTALPWQLSLHMEEKEEPERPFDVVIAETLEKHRLIWEQRKIQVSIVNERRARTEKEVEEEKGKIMLTSCPACGNYSLLYYEPDFDYSDGQSWIAGLFVTHLVCHFCDLNLSDYEEIDFFNLNERLQRQ